jgi:hypothetical protein
VPYTAKLALGVNAPGFGPLELPLTRSGSLSLPSLPSGGLGGLGNLLSQSMGEPAFEALMARGGSN